MKAYLVFASLQSVTMSEFWCRKHFGRRSVERPRRADRQWNNKATTFCCHFTLTTRVQMLQGPSNNNKTANPWFQYLSWSQRTRDVGEGTTALRLLIFQRTTTVPYLVNRYRDSTRKNCFYRFEVTWDATTNTISNFRNNILRDKYSPKIRRLPQK